MVPPGEEAAFLAPLLASVLRGLGPKTAERLAAHGMRTIGEITARTVEAPVREFGKHGRDLVQHARGIDERPVTHERVACSISKETTFARDVHDRETLWQTVQEQAMQVARKLRAERVTGTTVKLKLRWAAFTTLTRLTSVGPTDDETSLHRSWDGCWIRSGSAAAVCGSLGSASAGSKLVWATQLARPGFAGCGWQEGPAAGRHCHDPRALRRGRRVSG